MLKQMNRGEDDLGQTSALVQVHQATFPDHLLCAQHCAGFVGTWQEEITAMAVHFHSWWSLKAPDAGAIFPKMQMQWGPSR